MRAPVLAVGDGALGYWNGLREVFPDTAEQRRLVNKTTSILDMLPKSAKKALAEIWGAEDKDHARPAFAAFAAFAKQYCAKFPKAVRKLTDDEDVLLTFYDYPAEYWIHLRPRIRSSPRSSP
jgi:putative transposase